MFRFLLCLAAVISFPLTAQAGAKPIWRLYSPGGDHLLTNSCEVANNTQAPNHYYFEGLKFWLSDENAPGTTPFYRFFNGPAGRHFYAVDPNAEGAPNYAMEGGGPMGFIFSGPGENHTPLYRLFHNTLGDHIYVATDMERDYFAQYNGYHLEAMVGYVLKSGPTCPVGWNWVPDQHPPGPPGLPLGAGRMRLAATRPSYAPLSAAP